MCWWFPKKTPKSRRKLAAEQAKKDARKSRKSTKTSEKPKRSSSRSRTRDRPQKEKRVHYEQDQRPYRVSVPREAYRSERAERQEREFRRPSRGNLRQPRHPVRQTTKLRGHGVKRSPKPILKGSTTTPNTKRQRQKKEPRVSWADESPSYRQRNSKGGHHYSPKPDPGDSFAVRAATNRALQDIRQDAFRPSAQRVRVVNGNPYLTSQLPYTWDSAPPTYRTTSRYPQHPSSRNWI